MQEARDNLQLTCWGNNIALQTSWRDNRKTFRGREAAATDYNRKCKKYLKRARELDYWSIFDGYVNDPEYATILKDAGIVTSKEEARQADLHLARNAQQLAKTKSWSERAATPAIQDYVPVSNTIGGHMSQGGVESQHRMKNRFSDCRPR